MGRGLGLAEGIAEGSTELDILEGKGRVGPRREGLTEPALFVGPEGRRIVVDRTVGRGDRCTEGDIVGAVVGPVVGALVGDLVGDKVGEIAVGKMVGPPTP